MGRKSSFAGSGGGGGKKSGSAGKGGRLPADMYDDIDQFHRQKEKINLEASDSDSEDGSDDGADSEEGVYELSDAEDSDEEGSGDEDEKGMIGKLAKQAKLLGQKLKSSAKPDSDDDEEEGEEEEGKAKWGKKKRDYYNADTHEYELTDDEDAIQEEEDEAVRLQREAAKSLQPGDFGDEEDSEEGDSDATSDEEEAEEMTMERQAKEADGKKEHKVERIVRDPSSLSENEKISAVTANAPELLALLDDLQGHLAEIRHRIGPLLEEVRAGGIATKEGVSFLEAKHMLLLNYCMCITFYCLLKAEGKSVKDHPVILRLVQLKTYLDKIRPIEKKLTYQIDKLLSLAASNNVDELRAGVMMNDADDEEALLQFKPRLATLAKRNADGVDAGREEEGGAGVYRPPRINPTAMEGDPDAPSGRRAEERRSKEAVRRAARSETVRELMAEMEGAPEEVRGGGVAGMDTRDALRNKQRMEARDEAEENMFVRVSLTKEERKRMKSLRRAGLAGNGMLDDFADEVADIVGADDVTSDGRISQKFGGDMFQVNRKKTVPTGDAELPAREPLSDRRAKMDSKRARDAAAAEAEAMAAELRREDKRARKREDSTYSAAVEKAQSRLEERKSKFAFPEAQPPVGEAEAGDMRAITREIEKNRGLTPHRSKEKKNPRKKHRLGYAKAQVRRKGQVQEAKTPTGGYGGEETGIKARVTKSRKL